MWLTWNVVVYGCTIHGGIECLEYADANSPSAPGRIRVPTAKACTTMIAVHPCRILKRELAARELSANKLALALRVLSGRIRSILNGKRAIHSIKARGDLQNRRYSRMTEPTEFGSLFQHPLSQVLTSDRHDLPDGPC